LQPSGSVSNKGLSLSDPIYRDRELQALLEMLNPKARDDLRRVLIRDQADRDAISSQLRPYRDGHGDDWADIIDFLTMHPETRRRVVRLARGTRRLEQGT
jgi:hypothetical protein